MRKVLAVLAIACVLGSSAHSQANTQQGKNNATNSSNRPAYRQGTSENEPVFIKVLPSAPDPKENERRAAEDQEKAEKVKIDHGLLHYTGVLADYTRYLFWATAAVFAVTACLFAVAIAQFRDSRRAVAAAVASTSIAEGALALSERTAKQQLRAYVVVKPETGGFTLRNSCITAHLQVENAGLTPANGVCTATFATVKPWPLDTAPAIDDLSDGASRAPLGPGQVNSFTISLPAPLSETLVNALRDQKAAMIVWGRVIYEDVFGSPRRTDFCLYSTGPDIERGLLVVFKEGNEAT